MGRHSRTDRTGRGERVRKLAEAHHHTQDEIVGYIEAFREIVDRTEMSDEEIMALGEAVLGLIAAKQVLYEQPQASPLMLDGLHNLR